MERNNPKRPARYAGMKGLTRLQAKVRRMPRAETLVMVCAVLFVAVAGMMYMRSGSAATQQVFSSGSFWYQSIPNDAPRHPNSNGIVTEVVRQMKDYYGSTTRMNVRINTTDYAAPVYVADANTPRIDVGFYNCQNKDLSNDTIAQKVVNDYFKQVPIPLWAVPSPGTDAEMVVYSPSENKMWEFWVMQKTNGQFKACWGGRMDNVSQSTGIYPWPYGTTATGLPFMGGQITAAELQAGRIDHAIGIALPEPYKWDTVSWPANRSDGFSTNLNAPPEGLRLRLDPALNVDSLSIHPVAKTVAKAAQKYGFVIWDKAGAVSIRAENPVSFTTRGLPNPYEALYSPKADWNVLDGIPWDRLIALPMDYGKNITPPPSTTGKISQENNLATGKQFSSTSGVSPTYETFKVNDKDENTRWISGVSDATHLGTDLGSAHTLNKISILWAGDTTRNYDIQLSTDNITWKTIATGQTNNSSPQLIDTTSFTGIPNGRYFRIIGKDRWNSTYGHSIWELGIYGIADSGHAAGDINGDGRVNALDLSVLLSKDGQSFPSADFDGDGVVGAADMAILLGRWTW